VAVVAALEAAGAAVNVDDEELLRFAARGGCVELLQKMLSEGSHDPEGVLGVLIDACTEGQAEAVDVLLDFCREEDNEELNEELEVFLPRCLAYALRGGHQALARKLVAAGADVLDSDFAGRTGLLNAAVGDCVEVAKEALEQGADVSEASDDDQTALSMASSPEMVQLLLAAGAEVDSPGTESALLGSCLKFRPQAVQRLVEAKADVNYQAVFSDMMETPCKSDAPLWFTIKAICGYTNHTGAGLARAHASADDKVAVVQSLLDAGARTWNDDLSESALHLCNSDSPATLRVAALLLQRAPGLLERRDSLGQTPLAVAVRHVCCELVEKLIAAGADVNAKDSQGNTPLFHAVTVTFDTAPPPQRHRDVRRVLQLLLAAGADPEAALSQDRTALISCVPSEGERHALPDYVTAALFADVCEAVAARK
jgi:ankyrin repeat protein